MSRTSSAGTVAAPGARQPQGRHVGRRTSGCGEHQRPLRGHALGHGHPLLLDEAQGVAGLPRRGRDDRGDRPLQLVPHAGHVADVGEGQRREPAVAVGAQRPGAARHGRQVVVVEHRALGHAGGAAGPHDGHRVGRVERAVSRAGGVELAPRGATSSSSVITTAGRGLLDDACDLGRAEPRVDPRVIAPRRMAAW